VVTSRDVRIDKNVVYDPQHSKVPPQQEQALSATLNDVDIDESDNNMLLIRSNTAKPRGTQAGEQGYEALLAGLGRDGRSLQEMPAPAMLQGAPARCLYLTLVSLGSGLH
jgi:hypothetical protein